MRTTGLFTTHSVVVPCRSSETIHLVCFGDVHRDAPLHAAEEWQAFLEYARGLPQSTRFIGLGDYLDSTSTTERGMLGSITDRMHETFRQDVIALQAEKVRKIAKELDFMRGRILGLLGGNHYFVFPDQSNSDQAICRELGCQYLGVSAFVRIYFAVTQTMRLSWDMWLHHGAGAGRLIGSSVNRVQQMAEHAEADCYVMGDDHQRYCVPGAPRFYLQAHSNGGMDMKTRKPMLVRGGSFLKGYAPGKSSYIIDRGAGPRSIGHVELLITPHASHGEQWLEVHGLN